MEEFVITIFNFLQEEEGHKHIKFFIKNHYGQAAFGWLVYMVGKLWWYRNEYDENNDGLGWSEVVVFGRKNWITGLFNALLIAIGVPYAPEIWDLAMELVVHFNFLEKPWRFGDGVYIGMGALVLVVQLVIDVIRFYVSRRKTNH